MWQERFFHGKKQIGRLRPDEQILSGVALSQVVRVEMRKYMNFEELNLEPVKQPHLESLYYKESIRIRRNCKQSFFVRQESLLSSLQMRFVS